MKEAGSVLPVSDRGKAKLCRSAVRGDTRFICALSAPEQEIIRSALCSALGYGPTEAMQGRLCDLEDTI